MSIVDGGSAFISGSWITVAALALAGCASKSVEPVVRTVYVDRPVALECVPPALDNSPAYPDTDDALKQAKDAAERYALIAAGRLLRDARLGEVEPIILICRGEASK